MNVVSLVLTPDSQLKAVEGHVWDRSRIGSRKVVQLRTPECFAWKMDAEFEVRDPATGASAAGPAGSWLVLARNGFSVRDDERFLDQFDVVGEGDCAA
jgi:hypothetical protein